MGGQGLAGVMHGIGFTEDGGAGFSRGHAWHRV